MSKLSDFPAGTRVYSEKYKTHGTVDHPARTLVHVTMDNTGKIRTLSVSDLSIITESRPQREFRETRPKLRSTTFMRETPLKSDPVNSHTRRVRRRSSGADVSRMGLVTR